MFLEPLASGPSSVLAAKRNAIMLAVDIMESTEVDLSAVRKVAVTSSRVLSVKLARDRALIYLTGREIAEVLAGKKGLTLHKPTSVTHRFLPMSGAGTKDGGTRVTRRVPDSEL